MKWYILVSRFRCSQLCYLMYNIMKNKTVNDLVMCIYFRLEEVHLKILENDWTKQKEYLDISEFRYDYAKRKRYCVIFPKKCSQKCNSVQNKHWNGSLTKRSNIKNARPPWCLMTSSVRGGKRKTTYEKLSLNHYISCWVHLQSVFQCRHGFVFWSLTRIEKGQE